MAARDALLKLPPPGASLGVLLAEAARDGSAAVALMVYRLHELARYAMLHITATAGTSRLATAAPPGSEFRLSDHPDLDRPHVLSRFAFLHRVAGELVVESPRSDGRVILHDPRAAGLLFATSTPAAVTTDSLLALLWHCGLLVPGGEEEAGPLATWEFHDLLFHAHSRAGRQHELYGATWPFVGVLDPAPAVKPPPVGDAAPLFRPDLARLELTDPPLAQVMENRRSLRAYAAEPLSAEQLGEFLYRVGRVKEVGSIDTPNNSGTARLEITSRPYPSGGSLHELEIYPVVRRCRGLEPGLFHYDPLSHRLTRVPGPAAAVASLLHEAALSAGIEAERLQVLLVVAARFARVRWKYSFLAYALTLKNVGVLYQTMYLAATAMGLAPCALGAGNSDTFARAAGLDYYTETSVGEFLLGSTAGASARST
jgi:SagB-type dehydrogenase family enzyme